MYIHYIINRNDKGDVELKSILREYFLIKK